MSAREGGMDFDHSSNNGSHMIKGRENELESLEGISHSGSSITEMLNMNAEGKES